MREKQYKYETTKLKLIEMAARLPAGTPLPNRNRLAEQCGVARITLERAISELIGEGILASYDGRGTYAMGVKEQLIFPEINYDDVEKVRGMNIVFVTSAKTDEEAKALLALMGMPFVQG